MTAEQKLKLLSKLRLANSKKTVAIWELPEWTPQPKQAEFIACEAGEVLYGGAAGSGKALALDTPLATPSGWTTMGSLRVGDELFDEKGLTCRVTSVSEVFRNHECFEVGFDDGSSLIADADHRWLTFTDNDRDSFLRRSEEFKAKRRENRKPRGSGKRPDLCDRNKAAAEKRRKEGLLLGAPAGKVITTQELFSTLKKQETRNNHSISLTEPLVLPESILPVPPYTLGAWLGDGNSRQGKVYVDPGDHETLERIEKDGFGIHGIPSEPIGWAIEGLTPMLSKMGILKNKHVPDLYLRSSFDQRLELLRGLMDTDGTCGETGSVEFCVMNEGLAQGVLSLVLTLGIKATLIQADAVLNGKVCGTRYRINFTTSLRVFNLRRKAERQKTKVRTTQNQRYVVSCRAVDSVPTKCCSVDSPNRLFLAGRNLVPTHNSDSGLFKVILRCHAYPGSRHLIVRRTLAELSKAGALIDRSKEMLNGIATWRAEEKRWRFPDGGIIEFGYCEHEDDVYRYQGSQFDTILFEEAGQLTAFQIRYLASRCRTTYPGLSTQLLFTANPGGAAHAYLKGRFVDAAPNGTLWTPAGTAIEPNPRSRCFIPARLADNQILETADPNYRAFLEGLPDHQRRALLDGDWDVFIGQFFTEWNPEVHIADFGPEDIPEWWTHLAGMDWGFNHPTVILWAAVDDEGVVWVYRELKLRGVHVDGPDGLAQRYRDYPDSPHSLAAGHDVFSRQHGSLGGPTIAEDFQRCRVGMRNPTAGKHRRHIWTQVRRYLQWADKDGGRLEGRPWLRISRSGCPTLIEQIPVMRVSDNDPEDLQKTDIDEITGMGGDDAVSSLSHLLMQRPYAGTEPKQAVDRSENGWSLMSLWEEMQEKNRNQAETRLDL